MCFIFIVVEDLEYILKFSVYQNVSSSFKTCLTINGRSLTSSLCAFYLHCLTLIVTSFMFVYKVLLWQIKLTFIAVLIIYKL